MGGDYQNNVNIWEEISKMVYDMDSVRYGETLYRQCRHLGTGYRDGVKIWGKFEK